MQALDLVLLRRRVAATLLREHMDDDGAVPLSGVGEGLLHVLDVVAVDRPGVADPQRLEERVRCHHLAQRAGERVHARIGELAQGGQLTQAQSQALARGGVGGVESQRRQALGELGHRGRVGPPVVVEDDHDTAPRVAQVVESFVRHAAGQRPVPDHRDHLALAFDAAQREPAGDAVRVGERGRRVAVLDPVVLGLGAVGVARHAARLLQSLEAKTTAGQQLVDVGLVAGVPQDDVARGVEHPVQGEGELHHTQVRAEVPAGGGHRLDDERPDLLAQFDEFFLAQALDVGGSLDALQDHGGGPRLSAATLCDSAVGAEEGARGNAERGQGQDLEPAGGAEGL